LLTGLTDVRNPGFSYTKGKVYQGITTDGLSVEQVTNALGATFPPTPTEQVFLAQVAKESGYKTAQFGKLDWGFSTTPKRLQRHGWDYHLGYMDHVRAHGFYPPFLFENGKLKPIAGNTLASGGKSFEPETEQAYLERWNRVGKQVYSQDIFINGIIDYIRSADEQPFFIYFPTQLPHGPVAIPVVHPDFVNDARLTQIEKEYASMVKRLDDDVGRILDELKKQNIDDNTLVIFTSDNGHEIYYSQQGRAEKPYRDITTGQLFDNFQRKFYSERAKDVFNGNGGRAGLKKSNLQGGVNVPLIARWPGEIPAGTISNRLVASYDMLPTIAELVNYQENLAVDGLSYYQTLLGQELGKENPKEHGFIVYGSFEGPMLVTNDGWKIRSYLNKQAFELFYLPDDKAERNDLSKLRPSKLKQLKESLINACDGDLNNGFVSWHNFSLHTEI
jgi:arylsulfatase A-like enzyme